MSVMLSCGRMLARSECLALSSFVPQICRAALNSKLYSCAAGSESKRRQRLRAQSRTVCRSSVVQTPQPELDASAPTLTAVETGPGIDLIVGPMFAGKSTELLKRVKEREGQGSQVLLIKSRKDSRYHEHKVVTHSGQSRACVSVHSLADVFPRHEQRYRDAQVIAIDEAQFFPDLVDFCTSAADRDSKLVLVAGLDGDFMRQQFGQVLQLLPLSDSIVKLASECKFCNRKARFSMRISADITNQELVGGAESYAPVCRYHYSSMNRNKVMEDASG